MFQEKLQIDVLTVLLLLGESTIWKAVWGRYRSHRKHWRHWLFAVSPGWAPLAGSIFAAINGSEGPPNLIFERPPSEAMEGGLILTHLNSGASHTASNVIVQNVWQAWKQGPRDDERDQNKAGSYDVAKYTGLVDVHIDQMRLHDNFGLAMQITGLVIQFVLAGVLGHLGWSYEALVVLSVSFAGQTFLLFAVSPREEGWTPNSAASAKPCPVMLHKGLDSTSVLIIRIAYLNGRMITLEEYCYESRALRSRWDIIKTLSAGMSFLILILSIILVSWMTAKSKLLYLIAGLIGLAAHALEGASGPSWTIAFERSFKGEPIASPVQSGMMAAVGLLVAGRYPAGKDASRLLYPKNTRFESSLTHLGNLFTSMVCKNCRDNLNPQDHIIPPWNSTDNCLNPTSSCAEVLKDRIENNNSGDSKQTKDALAAVYHCLRRFGKGALPRVKTQGDMQVQHSQYMQYNWQAQPAQQTGHQIIPPGAHVPVATPPAAPRAPSHPAPTPPAPAPSTPAHPAPIPPAPAPQTPPTPNTSGP